MLEACGWHSTIGKEIDSVKCLKLAEFAIM